MPVPPGARQDIPQARQNTGAFHFGHTADPVYIGTCHGATASCSFAGYALESACHTGQECVYDVVADKGWRVGIGTHRIRSVINDVILQYDDVPQCVSTPECRDCAKWKMYESNGTEMTTTSLPSTTSTTRTRTETCKTPGWWGCLDETTATTSMSITSTSTCETPGWFGCKDKTTSVTTTAEATTTSEATTTCHTPGRFWGCYDEPTLEVSQGSPAITEAPSATSSRSSTPDAPSSGPTCRQRSWFGWCREWDMAMSQWAPEEI